LGLIPQGDHPSFGHAPRVGWLLVDVSERHRLGAWRIVLLGVPTLLASLACSGLFAFAWWLWFTATFAHDDLR
jgi:hypothetical protein